MLSHQFVHIKKKSGAGGGGNAEPLLLLPPSRNLLEAEGAGGCPPFAPGRCLKAMSLALRLLHSLVTWKPEQRDRGLAPVARALQWSSSRLLPCGNDTILNDPPLVYDLFLHLHIQGNGLCNQTAQSHFGAMALVALAEIRAPMEVEELSHDILLDFTEYFTKILTAKELFHHHSRTRDCARCGGKVVSVEGVPTSALALSLNIIRVKKERLAHTTLSDTDCNIVLRPYWCWLFHLHILGPTLPPSSSSAFNVNSLPCASSNKLPVHPSPGGNRLIVPAFTTPPAVSTSTVFDPSIGPKYPSCSNREPKGAQTTVGWLQRHPPHSLTKLCQGQLGLRLTDYHVMLCDSRPQTTNYGADSALEASQSRIFIGTPPDQ